MDNLQHHNLRTFQFFLSKVIYLLNELEAIKIDTFYLPYVKKAVILNSFLCAIEYKGNHEHAQDPQLVVLNETMHISKVIEGFVCKGYFDAEAFTLDINNYIELRKDKLNPDDPLEKLYYQYYCNTEEWCLKELNMLIDNLRHDRYIVKHYTKALIVLIRLEGLGFSSDYRIEAKKLMLQNIKNRSEIEGRGIDEDLFYIDDKELRSKVEKEVRDINLVLADKSEKDNCTYISKILQRDSWAEALEKSYNPREKPYMLEKGIFCKGKAIEWYNAIHRSDPGDIDLVRHWISRVYPSSTKREGFTFDKETLEELYKLLDEDMETDIVKKASIVWLKRQIEEIFRIHSAEIVL